MAWKDRLGRWGCYISQGLNVFLLDGSEDETTSSRIGKAKKGNGGVMPRGEGWLGFWLYYIHFVLIRVPFLKGHFIKAIEIDEGL